MNEDTTTPDSKPSVRQRLAAKPAVAAIAATAGLFIGAAAVLLITDADHRTVTSTTSLATQAPSNSPGAHDSTSCGSAVQHHGTADPNDTSDPHHSTPVSPQPAPR